MVRKLKESYDTKRLNELVGLIKRYMGEIESDASYYRRSKYLENAKLFCGDLGVGSEGDKNLVAGEIKNIYDYTSKLQDDMEYIMHSFSSIKQVLEENEESNSELFY